MTFSQYSTASYILLLIRIMQFLIRTSRVMRTQFCALLFLTFFLSVCVFHMQLYELDSDPKRKEFLDNLFSFMQKRGIYKEITFYGSRHVRMSSYRDLYDPDFSKLCPNALTSTPSSSFTSPRRCLCVFISERCSFLSSYHAVAPTITCVL